MDLQTWSFHKMSTLPHFFVPGLVISAVLIVATLAVVIVGIVRKSILRDGLRLAVLIGVSVTIQAALTLINLHRFS